MFLFCRVKKISKVGTKVGYVNCLFSILRYLKKSRSKQCFHITLIMLKHWYKHQTRAYFLFTVVDNITEGI